MLADGTSIVLGTVGYDRIFAKYDSSGDLLWSQQTGGPTSVPGSVIALGVDSSGNSYGVSSTYVGSQQKGVVISYSPTGTLRWSKLFDIGNVMAANVTGNGTMYVVSRYATTAPASRLTAINALGNVLWTSTYSLTSSEFPIGVTVEGSNIHTFGTGSGGIGYVKTFSASNGGLLGTLTIPSLVLGFATSGSYGYGLFYEASTSSTRVFKTELNQYSSYSVSNTVSGYPGTLSVEGNEIYLATTNPNRLARLSTSDLSIVANVDTGNNSDKIARVGATNGFINHRFSNVLGYFNGNVYSSITPPTQHNSYDLSLDATFGLATVGTAFNDASIHWFSSGTSHIRGKTQWHSGNVGLDGDAIPHAAIDTEGSAYFGATINTQARRYRLAKLFRNGTVAWDKTSPGALERLEGIAPTPDGYLHVVESSVNYLDLVKLDPASGSETSRTRVLATNQFSRRPIAINATTGYVDFAYAMYSNNSYSLRVVRARSINGQLYFNKGIAVQGNGLYPKKILYRPNGDIIVAGQNSTSQVHFGTMVACFASNGVLKWNKTFLSPPISGSTPTQRLYGDVAIDSSGNTLLLSYGSTQSGSVLLVTKLDGNGVEIGNVELGADYYSGYGSIGVSPKDGRIVVLHNYYGDLKFLNPNTLVQTFGTSIGRTPANLAFDKSGTLFLGCHENYLDASGNQNVAQAIMKISEAGAIQSTRRVAGTNSSLSATLTKILPGVGNDMWMNGFIATQNQGVPLSMARLIQPANPVGVPDAYTVAAVGTTTIAAPGLIANDTDANGDTLTAVLSTSVPTAQGTVVVNANGSFRFTPRSGFHGVTSFKYKAKDYDGYLSQETTVTITVP